MAGLNKVMLIGHVGKDPEVKYLEGGVAVAKFTLATTESYKDKTGNKVDQTEWHNVVVWRGLAEVAEKYVKKGSQLFIEGKIRSRQYEDKDKNKKYFTEIVADNFTMLGRKDDAGKSSSGAPSEMPSVDASNPTTDDLPF